MNKTLTKHRFITMGPEGHTTTEFDYKNEAEVREMRKTFDHLVGDLGYMAVGGKVGEKEREQIKSFDPQVEETMFLVPISGG